MGYQALARKWRPQLFSEVAGQQTMVTALENGLANNRLHHAYLFTGTRGVGKTTIARILAKCFNCEEGIGPSPCGKCDACISIKDGTYVDLIEVDAASRAKVEETREMLGNVHYLPTAGRYRVYLIDEVHMFSNHSFNALLKVLEEPPSHVVFIFATTDVERIPVTVLSRCLQFHLQSLSEHDIQNELTQILKKEGFISDEESIRTIAYAAKGSMRDALSLLELAINHGNGELKAGSVRKLFGFVGSLQIQALLDALMQRDRDSVFKIFAQLSEHAVDYQSLLLELASLVQQASIAQQIGDKTGRHKDPLLRSTVQKLAEIVSAEDLQLYYEILLKGIKQLPYAPTMRMGAEITLLRLLLFHPVSADNTARSFQHPPSNTTESSSQQSDDTLTATVGSSKTQLDDTSVSNTDIPVSKNNDMYDPHAWIKLIDKMNLIGLSKECADNSVLLKKDVSIYHLQLLQDKRSLLNKKVEHDLRQAFTTVIGNDVSLEFEVVEQLAGNTPSDVYRKQRQALQTAAEHSIDHDPNIALLREIFGATVEPDSVRPIEPEKKVEKKNEI